MKSFHLLKTVVVTSTAALIFTGCDKSPDTPADTLARIEKTGKIVIGHRESSDPISYIVAGKPIGYAVDICNQVAEQIKTELKRPDLKVEYKAVTSSTRIPEMIAGNIDMECGTTTNSKERQKQVNFSTNYYATEVRMAVKSDSGISKLADLDNKTIAITTGTTSDRHVKKKEPELRSDFNIAYGKDHSDSFAMVASGRAAAFVIDDNILAGLIAKSKNPKDFRIVGEPLSTESYGIMLAKGDAKMKDIADQVVNDLWKNGGMDKLYSKWFLSPIPPKNLNLNLPESTAFKALKANPTDEGI